MEHKEKELGEWRRIKGLKDRKLRKMEKNARKGNVKKGMALTSGT